MKGDKRMFRQNRSISDLQRMQRDAKRCSSLAHNASEACSMCRSSSRARASLKAEKKRPGEVPKGPKRPDWPPAHRPTITNNGIQMPKTAKQPRATARRTRATSPRPRATNKSLEGDFVTTPNGSFSLDAWLKLDAFERFWLKRDPVLCASALRKDRP
jgi:hypothetical protein